MPLSFAPLEVDKTYDRWVPLTPVAASEPSGLQGDALGLSVLMVSMPGRKTTRAASFPGRGLGTPVSVQGPWDGQLDCQDRIPLQEEQNR